jgi:hypothetical protein
MNRPQIDESRAHEYIGKTILLGVSYYDHDGNFLEQKQWHGVIETFSNSEGIRIRLNNSSDPCCLPPDPRAIRKAEPGIYTLRSTGETVENPDYLATWDYTLPGSRNTG